MIARKAHKVAFVFTEISRLTLVEPRTARQHLSAGRRFGFRGRARKSVQ